VSSAPLPSRRPGRRPARRSPAPAWLAAAAATAAAALTLPGCEPYRVEYHRRPAFFQEMSDEKLPDQVTLDNGTVVVYSDHRGERRDPIKEKVEAEGFSLRAEREDGTVELRALMPEHILAHALMCIRSGEYRLMWDQLVAEQTKLAYADQGKGFEEFEAFMIDNRVELARMLTRMNLGINMHECAQGYVAPGLYRVQFIPRVVMNNDGSRQFRFTKVDMVQEGFQLRLAMIH
jgi:hypothetical protein